MRLNFDQWMRLATVLGAVGSFAWGIWVWHDGTVKQLAAQERESQRLSETRRIEATRPFLDRQLALYTEASQVVAKLASGETGEGAAKARSRFWQLYLGELALVEDREVEAAMVTFGTALENGEAPSSLRGLSVRLAHACRKSLDESWGINAWTDRSTARATPGDNGAR